MKTSGSFAIPVILACALLQGCATTQLNRPPESMFKEGERLYQKGSYVSAIAEWKKVKESYYSPELSAQAEIGIADAYFMNGDFIEAAAAYEDFRKLHPTNERAEYALYRQAMSYYSQIKGIDTDQTPVKNALTILESYIKLYPRGAYLSEVSQIRKVCRDKQLQYEIYVGSFYLKSGKYPAAIARFEEARKNFPEAEHRNELLYNLVRAYTESDQKSKANEISDLLLKEFIDSPYNNEIKRLSN